jgi:hypothetical protein
MKKCAEATYYCIKVKIKKEENALQLKELNLPTMSSNKCSHLPSRKPVCFETSTAKRWPTMDILLTVLLI